MNRLDLPPEEPPPLDLGEPVLETGGRWARVALFLLLAVVVALVFTWQWLSTAH